MSKKTQTIQETKRRQFIKTGAVIAGAGITAGCTGGGGGQGGNTPADNGGTTTADGGNTTTEAMDFPSEPLQVIIPYSTGGGYNYYTRLTAKYINQEEYLEEPVRPQNVTGGGGIVGVNRMYNSEPDGHTFGIINTESMALNQARGIEEVQYDLANLTYYPNIAGKTPVIGVGTHVDVNSIHEFIDAMAAGELTVGHSGAGISGGGLEPAAVGVGTGEYSPEVVANNHVRYDGKPAWVTGIKREEVDTMCGSLSSTYPFVESGDIKIIFVMTRDENPPEEVSEADTFTDVDMEVGSTLAITGGPYHRPFIGPPDIPEERAEIVREAIRKAIQNPDLQSEAEGNDRPISFIDSEQTGQGIVDTVEFWNNNQDLIEIIFGE